MQPHDQTLPHRAGLGIGATQFASSYFAEGGFNNRTKAAWYGLSLGGRISHRENGSPANISATDYDIALSQILKTNKPYILNRLDQETAKALTFIDDLSKNPFSGNLNNGQPLFVVGELSADFIAQDKIAVEFESIRQFHEAMQARTGFSYMLATPAVRGDKMSVFNLAVHINELFDKYGMRFCLHIERLRISYQLTGGLPRHFFEMLNPAAIGLIELGGSGATHPAIRHEAWVLYSHLLDLIGPKPTLIASDLADPPMQLIQTDMQQAEQTLNAVRSLGPQMGQSHQIYR